MAERMDKRPFEDVEASDDNADDANENPIAQALPRSSRRASVDDGDDPDSEEQVKYFCCFSEFRLL